MLAGWRSMSQMLFRGNLDFARCLCDRDHNGYLSHFWADASTLEAIHSWMVPVQPVQPVQELLSSRQWFWGITRLSGLGNWHLKDWDLSRGHPAHHYVHRGLVYLLLTKMKKSFFSEAWLELRSFSFFRQLNCLPWTDRGFCPNVTKGDGPRVPSWRPKQKNKQKQTRHEEFCTDISFRRVSIELIR